MLGDMKDDRGRILVVDDEQLSLKQIARLLVGGGYSVATATNGGEALERLIEVRPELVFVDVRMPTLDGFATCRLIRSLSGGREVPIVLLTAPGDLEVHERAIESSADDFLEKPVQRAALLMRARSLIWLRRLRSELSHSRRGVAADPSPQLRTIFARASRLMTDPEILPSQRETAAEIVQLCETALGVNPVALARPRLPL